METYKYIIRGQPVSYSKAHYSSQNAGFTSTKEVQLIWKISLEGQHENRELITNPIEVFYEFFFDDVLKCKQNSAEFKTTPTLSDLIKFASEMACNVIWKDSRNIVRSYAEKFHSREPRTEITIIQRLK